MADERDDGVLKPLQKIVVNDEEFDDDDELEEGEEWEEEDDDEYDDDEEEGDDYEDGDADEQATSLSNWLPASQAVQQTPTEETVYQLPPASLGGSGGSESSGGSFISFLENKPKEVKLQDKKPEDDNPSPLMKDVVVNNKATIEEDDYDLPPLTLVEIEALAESDALSRAAILSMVLSSVNMVKEMVGLRKGDRELYQSYQARVAECIRKGKPEPEVREGGALDKAIKRVEAYYENIDGLRDNAELTQPQIDSLKRSKKYELIRLQKAGKLQERSFGAVSLNILFSEMSFIGIEGVKKFAEYLSQKAFNV